MYFVFIENMTFLATQARVCLTIPLNPLTPSGFDVEVHHTLLRHLEQLTEGKTFLCEDVLCGIVDLSEKYRNPHVNC